MLRPDFFCSAAVDPVYERLFCSLYGVSRPALPFRDIMHWSAMLKAWGLGDLAIQSQRVLVASGFFYGIHAPEPTAEHVAAAEERARELDCDWVLYPLLRRPHGGALAARGFETIPWFVESEYRIDAGVDADLLAQVGRNTAQNIRRLARKAEADYDLGFHWLANGDDRAAIDAFTELHWENLSKYGHPRNTHGPEQLGIFRESMLRESALVCLRRERSGGRAVQASLNLVSEEARALYMLVQGMRREVIPAHHNLYQAETYQLYRWGEAKGIRVFNLGRGGAEAKAMLGCNQLYVLDHHLAAISPRAARADLAPIREHAKAFVGAQLDGVVGRLGRGRYTIHQ